MAGASDKKLAQRNVETLSSIHKISGIINVLTLVSFFVLGRPSSGFFYYLIFSLPAFGFQYAVEKLGRPTYTINEDGYQVLLRPGDDLQQSGLTEYMFDVIYLTLLIDILMIISGSVKVWYLLLLIPAFAIYKTQWIWSRFLPSFSNSGSQQSVDETPVKSKRQAKLEKRQQQQQQQQQQRRR